MKILYLSSYGGGIKTYINILQDYFKKKNYKIRNFSCSEGLKLPGYLKHCYSWNSQKFIEKIKREIKKTDLLHVNFPCSSIELFIPKLCKKYKIPCISTFHLALGKGIFQFPKYYGKGLLFLYKKICKKNIFVSEYQKRELVGKEDKINIVIHNGVDTKKFRKKKVKRYFNEFTLGFLGRLDLEKNLFNLIKACKETKVNLAIAGKGNLYTKIKKFENEHIKVLGYVKDEISFYNAIDVYILPSFSEGLPFSLLEAMACEKPVIVSPIIKEINGEFCVKSKGFDYKELARSIRSMKERYNDNLGKKARKEVKKNFNLKIMLKKTEEVYKEVVGI